jgi:hypothetical protein
MGGVKADRAVALGLKPRTGRAVVVVVAGPNEAPEILGKAQIQVAFTFEEGAVFHTGQELPLEQAQALVREAEVRFAEKAHAELGAFLAGLGARVVAAAMAAPAVKSLPDVATILRSHALVHAAEGELYRRVFAAAAAAEGPLPARVAAEELGRRTAAAAGLTPAKVTARLAAMGKAAGRPWTVHEKEAALAAWLALASRR